MSDAYEQHRDVTEKVMDILETLHPLIDKWFDGASELGIQSEEVYDIQSDFQDLGQRMWRVALKSCRACHAVITGNVDERD